MFKTAIKGVAAHKIRLALTTLAIVLGVAFVSGTYVFTDSINARFDTLFSDVYAGIDVTVRASGDTPGAEPFDEDLLETVRAIDGVERAEAAVSGSAQIINAEGNPIGGQGPPTLGFSWVEDPALNILSISPDNGRAPEAAGEVVIDAATAESQGFSVGDTISVETTEGVEPFTLVGIANFGTEDNLAGATLAAFEFGEAQRLFDLEGKLTTIDVLGGEGVTPDDLVDRIGAAMPAGLEVVTGDQQTRENLQDVTEGLGFLNTALLSFAAVAVFVGAFIIQNTFRIIVGQRTRELALLRAVGATGRQVTIMVVLEALVVAAVASAIGVLAGIGVAEGVRTMMNAAGIGLPDGPLTVEARTIAVGMAVGVIVTLVAAVLPARKAAAVPPVAAMREEAAESNGRRPLRRRAVVGGFLTVAGSAAIAIALLGEVGATLQIVGAGALAVFLGASTLAPLLATPAARVLSAPFRGIVGRLARENTTRSPRRTASTASALMIGVALVAFVSVFAASIKASVGETLQQSFPADLALLSTNFESGVGAGAIDAVSTMDEAETVSVVYADLADVEGTERNIAGVDPDTIEAVYSFDPSIELADLGSGILVASPVLAEEGWSVGDALQVEYPTGPAQVEIAGTFEDQTFASFIVAASRFEGAYGAGDAEAVFVRLVDGVTVDEGEQAAEDALASFPSIQINTVSEQIEQAEAQVDQLLALFTGLLGLALIIAVLGIANTLALSIVERTREIGLLRAVGMGRSGIRRMVRAEAVIIAVFGALLGVAIGSGLGLAVMSTLADDGLGAVRVPGVQLAGWVLAGGVAGVVAAILPARKAARLDVLEAISYE